MRILFVCHRFPFPVAGGGKIRALKIIEHLQKKHELHVFSMIRGEEEYRGTSELKQICNSFTTPSVGSTQSLVSMMIAILKGRSLSEGYFTPPTVRNAMRSLAQRKIFDIAVVHSSSVGPLVAELKIPKVFDFCDVDSKKWELFGGQVTWIRRLLYRREAKKVRELENHLAKNADAVSVATPAELSALIDIAPATRYPFWFSNGVDTDYFKPGRHSFNRNQLCFVGRMDYLPNVDCVEWFVTRCWVKIREDQPDARFIVIGAKPGPRVLALEKYDGVVVTGTVEDVRPFLGSSVAMVAPLRIARGIQNKILESMAMGVPAITSGLCIDALSPAVARAAIRADSESEVVNGCLNMIKNRFAHRRLSVLGRRAVRLEASWTANLKVLDKAIDELIQGTGSRAN